MNLARCRLAVDRLQDDKPLFDAVMQAQFYMLHGWKLSGEADQLPPLFRY